MTTGIVFVVEQAAEGGYAAPAAGASIFVEADAAPKPIRLRPVHDEVIAA